MKTGIGRQQVRPIFPVFAGISGSYNTMFSILIPPFYLCESLKVIHSFRIPILFFLYSFTPDLSDKSSKARQAPDDPDIESLLHYESACHGCP